MVVQQGLLNKRFTILESANKVEVWKKEQAILHPRPQLYLDRALMKWIPVKDYQRLK